MVHNTGGAKPTITVITYGYPTYTNPAHFAFVKEVVSVMEREYPVEVINPLLLRKYLKNRNKEQKENIYYPLYFDFSFLKVFKFLRKLQTRLSDKSFRRAVKRHIKMGENRILYSHFLNAGLCAADITAEYGYPSFCAFGESSFWAIKHRDMDDVISRLKNISGFISVSTLNAKNLISSGIADEDKIIVLPNGVDHSRFYPKDKNECRKKLGLPQDGIIGVFVGHFIERKGIARVEKAVKEIPELRMMYLGAGKIRPTGKNVVFCDRVKHEKLPDYLSAADFFILPTEAEGCCNAIIEAMACGLPVISSKGEFNDDIIDETCSIRIDPQNTDDIAQAVRLLIDDGQMRAGLAEGAMKKSMEFDVVSRAKKIIEFINS